VHGGHDNLCDFFRVRDHDDVRSAFDLGHLGAHALVAEAMNTGVDTPVSGPKHPPDQAAAPRRCPRRLGQRNSGKGALADRVERRVLSRANARHLDALIEIVGQIRETGDLKKGLSDEDAARIIYYHFRFEQFTLLADSFGWGEDRARDWIRERVENALLDS